MKLEVRGWFRHTTVITVVGGAMLFTGFWYLPACANYFTKREIKSAYYKAAEKGLVAKPADVPDAVIVGAMCGNGGIPSFVQVRTSGAVTMLFSARRDKSSSDWSFRLAHSSTNYSKIQSVD
jgi:hypothetical protein